MEDPHFSHDPKVEQHWNRWVVAYASALTHLFRFADAPPPKLRAIMDVVIRDGVLGIVCPLNRYRRDELFQLAVAEPAPGRIFEPVEDLMLWNDLAIAVRLPFRIFAAAQAEMAMPPPNLREIATRPIGVAVSYAADVLLPRLAALKAAEPHAYMDDSLMHILLRGIIAQTARTVALLGDRPRPRPLVAGERVVTQGLNAQFDTCCTNGQVALSRETAPIDGSIWIREIRPKSYRYERVVWPWDIEWPGH